MSAANILTTEQAMQRIEVIHWNVWDGEEWEETYVLLVKEYLRRMALWHSALQSPYRWNYFDVTDEAVPGVPLQAKYIKALDTLFETRNVNYIQKATCQWYLHWVCLQTAPEILNFGLPAP